MPSMEQPPAEEEVAQEQPPAEPVLQENVTRVEEKEAPQFIREFSKEKSQEERDQTAQAIREKRAEHFSEEKAKEEKRVVLEQATNERETSLKERLVELEKLGATIEELSTSGVKRFFNHFKLKALQTDLATGKIGYEEMKRMQDAGIVELQTISNMPETTVATPEAFQEAEAILNDFYEKQKKKWASSEYTKEDMEKYFSEENLASLSIDDYALLLKRFPSEMVTHVTRQGIRDHTGHMYHTANKGTYTDSFMKMVADGRLRSPLGVYLSEEEKEKAVAKFLKLDEFKSKEEALDYYRGELLNVNEASGSYKDRMAIHFATEEVADAYYGSEKGNEIFIAYPSAFIASQYYFAGQLNKSGGGYWNDQWVWANEERGMNLNAGLVFIPEEARVDPKTGSRYELNEDLNPVENVEYQDTFMRFAQSSDFLEFSKLVMEVPEEKRWERFHEKLEKEYGITGPRLQSAVLDYDGLFSLQVAHQNPNELVEGNITKCKEIINKQLQNLGILYKEAKNAVNSKEFWEAYFAKNPEKKPSKVVYYKGDDPTEALLRWRKEQGIYKKITDPNIGFSERLTDPFLPDGAAKTVPSEGRFIALAEKVVDSHFSERELVAA